MPAPFDLESTIRPGQVLGGRYFVERVLGKGGMGVVVAARHVDLNTRFALKLMRKDAALDEESVERFLREARAAVRLKSKHCVQVIDVGRMDDGAPYMVMELLVGKDLGELLGESGARTPSEAVDYILQACEGIAEAHALGIIHRDLKPQNLFVTRGIDGMPLVKVLDFGLAKTLRTTPEVRALTQTTAVMGSPMYMSPEQMRASRRVDARSDQWSLAVCLYELLTGRTPFEGATLPEVCSTVLNHPPAPMPSDVPRALTRVIVRCLQKDPRRRYADVAELAAALEEFASARGAAARIRAVLDAPRLELGTLEPYVEADTKTGTSLDTTKRKGRGWGSTRQMREVGWASFAAVFAVVAIVGLTLAGRSAPPRRPATSTPLRAAESAASPPAQTVIVSVAPVAPPPAPSVAAPPPSKPSRARGTPRRDPSQPPTTAPVAQPKPSAPVLVPKTTEF